MSRRLDGGSKRAEVPALPAPERKVNAPLRVGVVGCGVIAGRYVEDAIAFDTWEPVACADADPVLAEAFAAEHRLEPARVDDLLAGSGIDLVLNLTPPTVHADLTRAALEAGKHVYTEKPLATTVAEGRRLIELAASRGLRLASAPDTFLGSAYEKGRALVESGAIGEPLGASATMLVGGPDSWHPNGDMFFRAGAGPLFDIAPYYLTAVVALLGRVETVSAFASVPTPERTLATGPRAGATFAVEVPTHAACVLNLAQGAIATLTVSFEARGQYVSGLHLFGTEAMLVLPDANAFGGDVWIQRDRTRTERVAYEFGGERETRGLGLSELVDAMRAGRPHRTSAEQALHVLEIADAAVQSAADCRTLRL